MIDLRCTRADVAGTAVLTIEGVADLAALPRLHDALGRFTRDHVGRRVAVDLDGVQVLDDAALGLLLGAAAAARSDDGDVVVVCGAGRLRDRLATTGFDRAVDVRAAIAAVADSAVPASYDRHMGEDDT